MSGDFWVVSGAVSGAVLTALMMIAGVALDSWWGEVSRWHPLVGFGRYVQSIERRLNARRGSYLRGGLAWLLAVLFHRSTPRAAPVSEQWRQPSRG